MTSETDKTAAAAGADPRPAAVTFVTTEHFTLQGARAATIAESTGRATMFLGSVSAGLVALGLIAAATVPRNIVARPVDSAMVAARAPWRVKCSVVTKVTAAGRGSVSVCPVPASRFAMASPPSQGRLEAI